MKLAVLGFLLFACAPAKSETITFNFPAEEFIYEYLFQVTAQTGPLNSTIVSVTSTEPAAGYSIYLPYSLPPVPLPLPAGANVTAAQFNIYGRFNYSPFGGPAVATPVQATCEAGPCPFNATVLPSGYGLSTNVGLVIQTDSGEEDFPGVRVARTSFALSGTIDYADAVRAAVANGVPLSGVPVQLKYSWDIPQPVTAGFNSTTTQTYDFLVAGYGAAKLTVQYEIVPEPATLFLLLAACLPLAIRLRRARRPACRQS